MAQEFTIKSEQIESKINQLLPSQGGFGAGVDFSASTMVIPIVDLTETAEGSSLRQDLQSSFSLNSTTNFNVSNTTSTLVNTTGYFRFFGTSSILVNSGAGSTSINITDGVTTKKVFEHNMGATVEVSGISVTFDFLVLLQAGDSITATTNSTRNKICGSFRQIATLAGDLVNP